MGNPFQGSAGQSPTAMQQLKNLYKSYTTLLPGMQNVSNQQLLPTAQAQENTAQATSPQQNQLNLQQLLTYGLPTAAANSAVTNQNAQAGAQTNLNTLTGAGGQAATAAQNLNRATNPDYFKNADAAAGQSVNALNAINLNGLSPGEFNSVERANNGTQTATGNLGNLNATNTLSNALNFGGAFNSKVGLLNNTLGTATGVGNMLQNDGFNSTATALSSPNANSISTFGSGTFGNTGPTGQNNLSNPLLGQQGAITGGTTAPQAQSNFQNSPAGMFQTNSSACCFIFLEALNGTLPTEVRKCRDRYYKRFPRIARGYIRMAMVLVPMMKWIPFVKSIVNSIMVRPLCYHALSIKHARMSFMQYKKTRTFWMRTWYILGA